MRIYFPISANRLTVKRRIFSPQTITIQASKGNLFVRLFSSFRCELAIARFGGLPFAEMVSLSAPAGLCFAREGGVVLNCVVSLTGTFRAFSQGESSIFACFGLCYHGGPIERVCEAKPGSSQRKPFHFSARLLRPLFPGLHGSKAGEVFF